MKITFKLWTEEELTELQAWERLADFYNEVRREAQHIGDDNLQKIEFADERYFEKCVAKSYGICYALNQMKISGETLYTMKKRIQDDIDALRIILGDNNIHYIAPTGTWLGCKIRASYCYKWVKKLTITQSE